MERLCQRCLDEYEIETPLAPHRYEMCETCMLTEDAYTDIGTCLFPDDHAPGHPADMLFRVHDLTNGTGEWEWLTEAEIKGYIASGAHFLFSSQWDWWFSP